MVTRKQFSKNLHGHDWYYAYSDDHRYWKAGRAEAAVLREQHTKLACPYDLNTLRRWAHKNILEQFAEEEPGAWYRQPRKYKCIASTPRGELITQMEYDMITDWFTGPRKPNDINHLDAT